MTGNHPTVALDPLLRRLLRAQLRAAQADAVLPRFARWVERSRDHLRGHASGEEELPVGDLWSDWEQAKRLLRIDPRFAETIEVLDVVLPGLPEILAGRRSVEDMLPASVALDGILRRRDPDVEAGCARAVQGFVEEYLRARRAGGSSDGVRILDLAPEGGAPDPGLAALRARHAAGIREYRRAASLDAEGSAEALGVHPGYDLLLVSGSGAGDSRQALRRLKPMLRRNGILVLDAITGFDLTAHLTIGILAPDQDGPLMPEAWLALLADEGFREGFSFIEEGGELRRHIFLAESDGVAISPAEPASVGQVSSDAALQDLVDTIRDSLATVLQLEPGDIRGEANFEEYGIDSLTSGRIINRIAGRYSVRLPATLMFDFSSVDSLSRHLLDAHSDAVHRVQVPVPAAPAPPVVPDVPEPAGEQIAAEDMVRRIVLDRPGAIEDIRIVTEAPAPLGPDEVRIAVRAFSLNFGDLLCVKGLYPTMPPYPFTPGMEVAGVVVACGAAVTEVEPGEAVVAMTGAAFGGHATMVTCPARQLWPMPEGLSFEEACSLPVAAITMLEVFRRAQLGRGERILIQTAAGGAGLVAIQLAQHAGAEIFATAGTPEKIAYLAKLGVPHCIDYLEEDFEAEVLRATQGRGVDVVINTLAGEAIQKGLNCLAPGGRYVEIAMTGLKGARAIDLSVLDDNQSFHSLDLRKQIAQDTGRMRALYAELGAHVAEGVIRPVLGAVVPFEEVDRAYRLLEQRHNIGKVVVQVPAGLTVAALPARRRAARPSSPLRSEATGAGEPIAVVGLSGRFPGSADLDALWAHLAKGTDLTEKVSRWDLSRLRGGDPREWRGGFLSGIDRFDAGFFGITDIEALYMDPQQRVFLEEAWNALENAGYAGAGIEGRACGVYVGAASVDYAAQFEGDAPAQAFWGNVGSVIPARIAYYLNLRGPAVAVDTACSSSLVAIHLACQALWLGEVEMALAGGVFLQPGASFFLQSITANMLSPSGRCHAFDDRADGFVPGEGVGVLALKRLADAIADGDHVHGVIRGIGTNQDGKTSGITAPSGEAQSRLERQVYDKFGIAPATIQLVEAHGTGTKLGDPIEYHALRDALGPEAIPGSCALGSIKTNFGHAVTAAGVAGVLKVLLALRHRQIPPSLHFTTGNTNIDFANSPLFVNTALIDWQAASGSPRRGAVSSFGFSGTNAHAVIEEAPPAERAHAEQPAYLVALSGRSEAELRAQAGQLLDRCERDSIDLGDLSFTLLLGRRHLDHRLALAVHDVGELRDRLRAWLAGASPEAMAVGKVRLGTVAERTDAAEHGRRAIAELEARAAADPDAYRDGLVALAALFVSGGEIDFGRLYHGGGYGRIPLPTYPFARQSYWVGKDAPEKAPPALGAVQTLTRNWVERACDPASSEPPRQRHWIFLDADLAPLQPRLSALLPDADIDLLPDHDDAAEALMAGASHILTRIGAGLRSRSRGALLVQAVGATASGHPEWLHAISGMFRSATLEDAKFAGQTICFDGVGVALPTAEALAMCLRENRGTPADTEIRYCAAGKRQVSLIEPCPAPQAGGAVPWKDGGVYLIAGGGGALGRIFAREIAACRAGAAVILTGRSMPGPALTGMLEELRAAGFAAEYRPADLTDPGAVEALIGGILRDRGRLDGVLHAAGIARDDFLIRKDGEQFRAVLAPKISGVQNLDRATRDLALDFFVAFSSVAAVYGNAGQSDYATANAYLDRFAEHRAGLVARGERSGRTVSIGWPLWADGGMAQAESVREHLARAGMPPLETHLGIGAFYDALASGRVQTIVLPGTARIEAPRAKSASAPPVASATGATIEERMWDQLVALMREVTLLAPHRFDTDATFESFGIDSVMIVKLNDRLAERFDDLPKTLFFEYPTLREVRDHLLAVHPDACSAWCDADSAPAPLAVRPVDEPRAPFPAAAAGQDRIAVIGLSGVYPGADTLDRFWENLAAGRSGITEIPPERWSLDVHHCDSPEQARQQGRSYCKVGGFLAGFAEFDPLFFGIAPTEALSMDPQERLFLQACWHAMEDAAYTRASLAARHARRVGVFAGVSKTGYELYGPEMWRNGEEVHLRTSFSSVANRVSYLLDLGGPSVAVDTMCSSSLTAIHQACESLLRDECALAFAGGVNLYLHPQTYATLCAAGMLSPSGVCRSFGAGADGFVPGEGVGAVLLKRLDRAVADGDPIHAVIRASAVNHGGHTHGYTVPNPRAQRALVRAALDKAGVDPQAIGYVEAHGTGTPLGDPVEIAGLSQAFAVDGQERQFCAIGSVKASIGHLEAAAGIAGLTKVILQLKHGMLVPSLHAEQVNPDVRFEQSRFRLQRELAPWPAPPSSGARLAGISSFGAGGANTHLIVEEHRDARGSVPAAVGPAQIILSARNPDRLRAHAARLAEWLGAAARDQHTLHDLAYTLQVGREAMACRLAFEVESTEALAARLGRFAREGDFGDAAYCPDISDEKDRLAAMPGQGDAASLAGTLIARGDLARLRGLWARGLAVDWSLLHAPGARRRISLPGYPFARERYWPRAAMAGAAAPEAIGDDIRLLLPAWEAEPAPVALRALADSKPVLVVVGDDPVPDSYAFAQVLRLAWDAGIDAYVRALATCGALDQLVWRAPSPTGAAPDDDAMLRDLHRCILPCFRLVKALLELGYDTRTLDLTLITRNGIAVAPGELADPAHAAVHGFAGSLAKEQPNWLLRVIDVAAAEAPPLARILSVAADPLGGSAVIRGEQVFRQTLYPATAPAPAPAPYRQGGVYVMIGGAGHIGSVFSELLIRDHQAQLVWIGRRPLDAAISAAIDRLATLGPAPRYIQADARDRAALERAHREIRADFGTIHGLIHSAIVLDDASVARIDEARFLSALTAKADSCVRMMQVFGEETPDFVLFFSSLESFGKLAGQSNYAAACLFADTFAQRLRAAWRVPVKVLNWGSWEIVDGRAISPVVEANMAQRGVGLLTAREGLAGVASLLSGPFDQIGYYKARPATLPPSRAEVAAAPGALREVLVEKLREALRLADQPVRIDEPFAAYGVDSITGIQFIRLVSLALGIELDVRALYDHPSIGALAAHIAARLHTAAEKPVSDLPPPATVRSVDEPVAVVGLSARYPGAPDADALWQLLVAGTDLVGTATRWGEEAAYRHGGFLDDIADFDPFFFGIGKPEARYMDPQQRIFLEEAWHALENAGYGGAGIRGARCGIYVGHNGSDYHLLFPEELPPQALWGNAASILSARIAYHLDLQGPALTVDTACSSSLVAIHLACQALRNGEVDLALAGGAQVYCTPGFHTAAGKAGMLSPSGRCHSFDARADGFVPAEGAGVVVLKRLGDAVAARDHIYGVIRGSATNQDGATNGITAPSGLSQERLERQVYREAGVRPRDIQLVEAHGTGTRLGDPIEFGALATVFGEDTSDAGFCALGSIKTNIGHALAAAGVAGAIKLLLALRHEQIPPSIHFDTSNAQIRLAGSPFHVPHTALAWPRDSDRPRLGAVSAFGFSGTNAHMLIGEAPPLSHRAVRPGPRLILLSAKGKAQLHAMAQRLRDHCARAPVELGDLSYTLAIGRHHFAHRLALVAEDGAGLCAALSEWLAGSALRDGFVAALSERDIQDREQEGARAARQLQAWRDGVGRSDIRRLALLELARLHVEGYPVPLEELFEGDPVGRIPLPPYPFRREHCWVGQAPGKGMPEPASAQAAPETERRVTVELSPEDPRVRGHYIGGQLAVPGVTCLDLVREALGQLPILRDGADFADMAWLRPILLGEDPLTLAVDFQPAGEGRWTFALRRSAIDSAVYCRGTLLPRTAPVDAPDGGICAQLHGTPDSGGNLLHPLWLEGALQAWAATKAAAAEQGAAAPLLASLAGLALGRQGDPVATARIRELPASAPDEHVLDIDLCGLAGGVVVAFRGLVLRARRAPAHAPVAALASSTVQPATDALCLVPHWAEASGLAMVEPRLADSTIAFTLSEDVAAWVRRDLPDATIVVLAGATAAAQIVEAIEAEGEVGRVLCCLQGEDDASAGQPAALQLVRIAKALLRRSPGKGVIELVTVTRNGVAWRPGEPAAAGQAAVQAVAGCLAKEAPNWRVKAADIAAPDAIRLAEILRLPADPDGDLLAFRDGRWFQRRFARREMAAAEGSGFRRGGVYAVIGGAGALGEVLSEHLVRNFQAQLIWIGRRPLDAEIQARIDRLAQLGPAPRYICADARDPAGFKRVLDTIAHRHAFLDGLVHAALVMSGSDIAHMGEEKFTEVFSTKADICENIERQCVPGSIGLILFFSSIQSLQRTERQANYAAGCAFKDAWAGRLAGRLGCPVKTVNWGYWGSVGQAAGLNAFQNWLKQAGMGSIEPEEGMAFLERFLASPFEQAAYVKIQHGTRLRGMPIDEDSSVTHETDNDSVMDAMPRQAPRDLTAAFLADRANGEALEGSLGRMLCMSMYSLGLFERDRIDPASWCDAAGIAALYRPWVEESLRVLAGLGYLEPDALGGYRQRVAMPAEVHDLWQQWAASKAIWNLSPQLAPFVELVETSLRALPDILTGRTLATEILFPGASLRLVEPIYKHNATADYFNQVLAESLVAYLRERVRRDPHTAIRILEVGAGTGGTTALLVERLASHARHVEEYRYTDLSMAFLSHGREQYGPRAPYLRYALFDVERAPEDQDIPLGHFDVVIATNVLHATRDIRRTLDNVAACLKPGGILLLNEMSANSLFSHLTFGLLKGWWLSEDPEVRIQGSPVVPQESWDRLLAETGFGTVHFPTQEVAHLGNQIVIAQKGGAVRVAPPATLPIPAPVAAVVQSGSLPLQRDPAGRLRQAIVEQVSRALEIDAGDIDPDIAFADYGIDSILAIATVDALNAQLDLELTSTSLFEHSSVNLLADHILRSGAVPVQAPMPATPIPPVVAPKPAPTPADRRIAAALPEPIAIIGASGRFGGADSLAELWDVLAAGEEQIGPVSRWDLAASYGVPEGTEGYCWRGGFLSGIECFDPTFFNISGIEATYMDPQQRLFLEEAWRTLEDGGYAGAAIEGQRCGVYVGQNGEDYRGLCAGVVPPQAMWGNAASVLSARISYYLNLKGPAITIDTACSSSLVAVHLACQALRLGEIDMAIAGGVAARCTPEFYTAAGRTGMLSTSGHCHAFDSRADGFIPGEGVGAVLLKRLSDALADGDQIQAVIRGSCLNQDGTTNGITAPNAAAQEQLELETYAYSGTHPEQIQLVEAHGTGTRLGDPIEHEALTRAFRRHSGKTGFCALGSIKANIGHATAAAGIASIMKVILALRHRQIPPSPNFVAPNPLLALAESPFYVNTDLRDWPEPAEGRRCAAISSFGISGTNAHLVLEEGRLPGGTGMSVPAHLVVLSARSAAQLRLQVEALVARCEAGPSLDCADISYTLLTGRKHLAHRIALVVRDTAQLLEAARQYLLSGTAPSVHLSGPPGAQEVRPLLVEFGNRCLAECAAGAQGADYVSRLDMVADLFVQRAALDFAALFAGRAARRVSLPTYPFARERYWAADTMLPAGAAPMPVADVAEDAPICVTLVPDADLPPPQVRALGAISRFIVEELRLPADKVSAAEDLQAYGMDSLISMKLTRRLEQEFGIALSNADMLGLRTVGELVSLVATRIESPPAVAAVPLSPEAEAERCAAEVLARLDSGELDLEQAEALLREIALA